MSGCVDVPPVSALPTRPGIHLISGEMRPDHYGLGFGAPQSRGLAVLAERRPARICTSSHGRGSSLKYPTIGPVALPLARGCPAEATTGVTDGVSRRLDVGWVTSAEAVGVGLERTTRAGSLSPSRKTTKLILFTTIHIVRDTAGYRRHHCQRPAV